MLVFKCRACIVEQPICVLQMQILNVCYVVRRKVDEFTKNPLIKLTQSFWGGWYLCVSPMQCDAMHSELARWLCMHFYNLTCIFAAATIAKTNWIYWKMCGMSDITIYPIGEFIWNISKDCEMIRIYLKRKNRNIDCTKWIMNRTEAASLNAIWPYLLHLAKIFFSPSLRSFQKKTAWI